jgi:hypothetical protein
MKKMKKSTAFLAGMAAAPTVSGVTVSPKTATVGKGETLQFSAEAAGTNSPSQTVAWSITTGGTKMGTSISASGLLTVAEDETKISLEIKRQCLPPTSQERYGSGQRHRSAASGSHR